MVPQTRIAIMGTPVDSGNRGVLALAASLINLCSSASGQSEVFLMLGHRNSRPVKFLVNGRRQKIQVVNCRLSPRSRWRDHLGWILVACIIYRFLSWRYARRVIRQYTPWIAALEKADIVGDVRGGDSFSDIYGIKRFLNGFLIAWTVLLVKGTMVQFPQTFGLYKSRLSRLLAAYLLRKSSVVIARDEKSQKIAQKLIGPSPRVWISPDVAFSMEAVAPGRIDLDPPLEDSLPSGVIGLNVNGLMASGGYTRKNMFGLKLDYRTFLPELVTELLHEHQGELWLVPHTYGPPESVESDPEACRRLRNALPQDLKKRVRIVAGEYDQHEIKWIIGQCDFFIGSRMHACIAALSQGIPCVGIAYSRKFEGVFDSVGMNGWVVDGRTTHNAEAIDKVLKLYRIRDDVRKNLARNADAARKQLQDVFRRLISTATTANRF